MVHTTAIAIALLLSFTILTNAQLNEKLEHLNDWADTNVQASFRVKHLDNYGLSAIAKQNIKMNDPLIQVPLRNLISLSKLIEDPFIKDFDFGNFFQFDIGPMALWLTKEVGNPKSPFKSYFDILPSNFPNHLFNWSEKELEYLAGTGLDVATKKNKKLLHDVYTVYTSELNSRNLRFPNWSYENFVWAVQIIHTRAWNFVLPNGTKEVVLVPFADCMNHKPGTETATLEINEGYFVIKAGENYLPGEQVFTQYQKTSNADLLQTYGFLLEDNPEDYVEIRSAIKPKDFIHPIVFDKAMSAGIGLNNWILRKDEIPSDLLRIKRLKHLKFTELKQLENVIAGKPVSSENDFAALHDIASALRLLISYYPTSLTEDENMLKFGDSLPTNYRNALILTHTQKKIIRSNIIKIQHLWQNLLDIE